MATPDQRCHSARPAGGMVTDGNGPLRILPQRSRGVSAAMRHFSKFYWKWPSP